MGRQTAQHVGNIFFCHSFQRLQVLLLRFRVQQYVSLCVCVFASVGVRMACARRVERVSVHVCVNTPQGPVSREQRRHPAATMPAFDLDLRRSALLR